VVMIQFQFIKMQIKTQEYGEVNFYKEKDNKKMDNQDLFVILISKLEE